MYNLVGPFENYRNGDKEKISIQHIERVMHMVYIGIDPGQKGGYAIIDGNNVAAYPWDDKEFIEFAKSLDSEHSVCCLEKVGAMPKQGVSSTFSFGKAAGFIEGVLQTCGIAYQLVPPQKWKKEFSISADKNQSIAVCKRLFPNVSLRRTDRCTTDSDGMAESLLMSLYAKRKM